MFPGEEFLPAAPNPEDVVWGSEDLEADDGQDPAADESLQLRTTAFGTQYLELAAYTNQDGIMVPRQAENVSALDAEAPSAAPAPPAPAAAASAPMTTAFSTQYYNLEAYQSQDGVMTPVAPHVAVLAKPADESSEA